MTLCLIYFNFLISEKIKINSGAFCDKRINIRMRVKHGKTYKRAGLLLTDTF